MISDVIRSVLLKSRSEAFRVTFLEPSTHQARLSIALYTRGVNHEFVGGPSLEGGNGDCVCLSSWV